MKILVIIATKVNDIIQCMLDVCELWFLPKSTFFWHVIKAKFELQNNNFFT